LMLICSNAVPGTKLCTDPMEMQKFLTVVTLMRGFTMGAPPFGSPGALVSLIQGKGFLAPLITAAGLEPVTLVSPDVAKKQMTTSSKVFSLYATGIVKAGKRESRVHIHVVVDFRSAPEPGSPTTGSGTQPGAAGTATSVAPQPQTGVQSAAAAQQDAIAALTRPNPAGNVVYFKMD
ncbi:MAG TPA: hypothetical protein VFQ35_26845, partial [Polyangiaceae bacterium]|nr:hypothetical protein [Polyangiaceae bacterium]